MIERVVAVLVFAAVATGCETAEQVEFGEPSKVGRGFEQEEVETECVVNNACTVSFSNRIFAQILDAPLGGEEPSGGCGLPLCHNNGAGGLRIPQADAEESYFQLVGYQLAGGRAYIVPCHPELSHVMCNLKFADGVENPYVGDDAEFTGGCGSPMPKPDEDVEAEPLNRAQLEDIAEWIGCGAPLN